MPQFDIGSYDTTSLHVSNDDTGRTVDRAMRCHRSGRYREAEALYRQVVTREPDNGEVLYLLGMLLRQRLKNEVAVDMRGRVVRRASTVPQSFNRLGDGFRTIGHLDAAVTCYRRALALNPDFVEAYLNLSAVLGELKSLEHSPVRSGEWHHGGQLPGGC